MIALKLKLKTDIKLVQKTFAKINYAACVYQQLPDKYCAIKPTPINNNQEIIGNCMNNRIKDEG